MRLARRGRVTRNFECRYVHKDGRVVTLNWTGVWSEPEQQHFFIGRDITALKETQQALENSERSFHYVFENSPLPMWVYERASLRFLAANHAATSTYGYTSDEFLAMRIGDIRPSEEIGRMTRSAVEAVAYMQTSGWRHRTKDGRILDVDIYSHDLNFDGKSARMVVAIDVTARKTAEAQLAQAQKMEAVGNLTGGMAHDFNNLLGVIIGNLDLLRDRQTGDPEAGELTGEALDAAMRGADLTQRLLAFARRQPLQPERTDLNRLVSGIGNLLKRTLGEQIGITLQLGAKVWPVVVDPAQLESSLTNLATNARDAMPKGGDLTIATSNRHLDADYASQYAEVAPGDYAMIEVTDTGTGIPPEIAGHIFEPFYTTKEQGRGTGLGLSMVFGFMKQSGGHINLYSEVGIGTTFRLYLPRAAGAAEITAAAPAEPLARGVGETVLAVEDNASLRRVVVRQLGELGYRVIEAEDAQTALRVLESEPVDLLFTDIVMPGGSSGYDLAHAAQLRWPDLKVVLTSGFPEIKTNGNGAAPNLRLLSKPYRRDDLARAIREVLEA
jgi:PAS domain S-box-containing protein